MADTELKPDDIVLFYENWIPGIGECTKLHDQLHEHFNLGYSVRDEAKLLGFQLGHHAAGNFFHVLAFTIISMTVYPSDYRNKWEDIKIFYHCYLLGKEFQMEPYWFIPTTLFDKI